MMSKTWLLTVVAGLLVFSVNVPAPRKLTTALAVASASAQGANEVEERIRRVENGLLPAVMIKGQPAEMKLADRMKFYRIPGVSVAVINNGSVEWARGFGVVEDGVHKQNTHGTL